VRKSSAEMSAPRRAMRLKESDAGKIVPRQVKLCAMIAAFDYTSQGWGSTGQNGAAYFCQPALAASPGFLLEGLLLHLLHRDTKSTRGMNV
jgi:hypothetical protein